MMEAEKRARQTTNFLQVTLKIYYIRKMIVERKRRTVLFSISNCLMRKITKTFINFYFQFILISSKKKK